MPSEIVIERPRLAQYQRDMLYCEERNSICEATTKAGKTFSHMWWLFELAHKAPKKGANYWWVAPVFLQAEIAFNRIVRTLPRHGGYKVNLSNLTISTPLDTIIWFKSGEKPDNLYGEDVYGA